MPSTPTMNKTEIKNLPIGALIMIPLSCGDNYWTVLANHGEEITLGYYTGKNDMGNAHGRPIPSYTFDRHILTFARSIA
jgi:hypothetical protein